MAMPDLICKDYLLDEIAEHPEPSAYDVIADALIAEIEGVQFMGISCRIDAR